MHRFSWQEAIFPTPAVNNRFRQIETEIRPTLKHIHVSPRTVLATSCTICTAERTWNLFENHGRYPGNYEKTILIALLERYSYVLLETRRISPPYSRSSNALENADITLNLENCQFSTENTDYFGHVICPNASKSLTIGMRQYINSKNRATLQNSHAS